MKGDFLIVQSHLNKNNNFLNPILPAIRADFLIISWYRKSLVYLHLNNVGYREKSLIILLIIEVILFLIINIASIRTIIIE